MIRVKIEDAHGIVRFERRHMQESSTANGTEFRRPLLATLTMTLLVSIGGIYLWQMLAQQQEESLRDEFETVVAEMKTRIAERMTAYGQVLKGGRSLFYASDEVTREEWATYVATLDLSGDYPGIQGFGFAVALEPEAVAHHETKVRAEGFADYRLWPEGSREAYSAIIYLEPFDWRNRRAFGYDMFSEPVRREAMARARDSGLPALSGKVMLVQETDEAPQAGTLHYIPLYRKGAPLESLAQRRQALTGWVYSPYRMENLIEGMLGKYSGAIRLRVYDERSGDPERLLYDSAGGQSLTDHAEIHSHLELEIQGRLWKLDFEALPGFRHAFSDLSMLNKGAAIALISLLLILLTWNLFNTQRRASLLAQLLTRSLRESEERWGFALEGSGDGVWDCNIETGTCYYSRRYLEILGLQPEELERRGDAWQARLHPEDAMRVKQKIEQYLHGKTQLYTDEHRLRSRDGDYVWVLARGKVISRSQTDGHPVRFVGTISDISPRKLDEERIQLLLQAIRQSGEGVMLVDAGGVSEYANPAFCKLTGYSEGEVKGQPLEAFVDQGRTTDTDIWPVVSGGDVWQGRIKALHKGGSRYPAMLTVAPVEAEAGKISHYVVNWQDLTGYEELEARFHQAQKMEAVGTLVGGIAHDFNNTLAAIVGNLYLAKREARENPKLLERLVSVERLSFQAAEVIRHLLTFSRKSRADLGKIALVPFIKEAVKLQRVTLPENIELRTHVCSDDLRVMGDINLLQQALVNLMNNARDALHETAQPIIEIGVEKFVADKRFRTLHPQLSSDLFAHISVRDNGHGIKKEHINKLFDPFFTTKGVDEGTGLGLAMVFGAVASHQGVVTVDSEEGRGTTFHIYLPLSSPAAVAKTEELVVPIMPGSGETVLLADDDPDMLETSRNLLESLNYRVLTAVNGEDAVAIYHERHAEIALVLLDVVMPKMGGAEALRLIRRINPDARALFATGYDRGNVLQDKDMSDVPVLNKPFAVELLSHMVADQLA